MEPGSQLTSVLNRNKIQVSKKAEAQMHTLKEKEERKTLGYLLDEKCLYTTNKKVFSARGHR